MYHITFLIAVGPCLIMALASAAMFILSNTLARTRHAWLWALSFAIYSFEWALIALSHAGRPDPLVAFMFNAATVASLFCYFAGFLGRQDRLRMGRLIALATLVFCIQIGLTMVWRDRISPFWGALHLSATRLTVFTIAAALITPRDRPTSATERSVIGMLVGLALINLALIGVVIAQFQGRLPFGTYTYSAAVLGTPTAAAMGLFTLMLIASDFSRERLRIIHTDPLTAVLNRMGFEQTVQRPIMRARPGRRPLALIVTDIDRFKGINDSFGHLTGDATLISFARCLADGAPSAALVGRLGGEEFALLLEGYGASSAADYAEAIRSKLPRLQIPGGRDVAMTASFGVAELLPGEAFVDLFARADAALYLSKQEGRNRTSIDPARAA